MLSCLSWETSSWAHWSCISVSVMSLHQTRGLLQVPCAQPFTRLPEEGSPEHHGGITLTLLNSTKSKPHWFNGARILLVCLLTFFSRLSIRYWAYTSYVSFRQSVHKEDLPMEWFIAPVSGMSWTTFLRKIIISLSLIPLIPTTLCCTSPTNFPAGREDKQKGGSPKMAEAK